MRPTSDPAHLKVWGVSSMHASFSSRLHPAATASMLARAALRSSCVGKNWVEVGGASEVGWHGWAVVGGVRFCEGGD